MKPILHIFTTIWIIEQVSASLGDSSYEFRSCFSNCANSNCNETKKSQPFMNKLLLWSCADECQYECMWRMVEDFIRQDREVPQFFGKWPFIRFLGIQEPASAFFSIANLVAHIHQIRRFRSRVRPQSPFYKLYLGFVSISINCCIWSTVFHTRDFPITEFLDYTATYLNILGLFYLCCMRIGRKMSATTKGIMTVLFAVFYLQYFYCMAVGTLSYAMNMDVNVFTGTISGLGWIIWCIQNRKQTHCKWMLLFYFFFTLSSIFEIWDFPPYFWVFDAHSCWQLSTVPAIFVLYKFFIEDCKFLRETEVYNLGLPRKSL